MLVETKITLKDIDLQFLNTYKSLGFNSQDELLSQALELLKIKVAQQQLESSADLYAEVYKEDEETQGWVNASIKDWE